MKQIKGRIELKDFSIQQSIGLKAEDGHFEIFITRKTGAEGEGMWITNSTLNEIIKKYYEKNF